MIEVVSSTSAGKRRAPGSAGVKRPTKRRKTKSTFSGLSIEATPKEMLPDKHWSMNPDQVFRFMDLPGELRNRIYEFAVEWSRRCFPHTHAEPKKFKPKNQPPGDEYPRVTPKPLPFIGLTQTCTVIRTEFRPLWLTTHRFPLLALNGYFRVFFPSPLRASQTSDEVRKRIERYNNPAGTLRLWIGTNSFSGMDIMPIIKFRVRFPRYTIVPVSGHPNVTPGVLDYLSTLINNTNPIWIRNVKRYVITQVRLLPRDGGSLFRIVVKQSHAPNWLSPLREIVKGEWKEYGVSLGLDEKMLQFSLGINYS